MAHSAECMRNFDINCGECIEWKNYQQGLDERRTFLIKYWAHLEGRTENQILREPDVNPRLKPTNNEAEPWKCAFCRKSFPEKDDMKKHLESLHKKKKTLRSEMDERNTTNEAKAIHSMPEKNTSVHEKDTSTSGQEVSIAKENASLTEENTLVNEDQNTTIENTSMAEGNTSVNEENTSMDHAQMNEENTSGSEEDILTSNRVLKSVHENKKSYKSETCDF